MGRLDDYKIAFVGLKEGEHNFSFKIDDKFFDFFENSLIDSCEILAELHLHKKPGMMECSFEHNGVVHSICDRCGQPMEFGVAHHNELIFKFSDNLESNSDEIIYIPQNEFELDVAKYFYEFISLSLPSKKIHAEGECDEEIIELLDELNTKESMDSDPRWDVLKNLKKEDK